MIVFIIVVAILFVAAMLGYVVVRLDPLRTQPWRETATPGLPHSLVLSTLVIVASSASLHWSLVRVRRGDRGGSARALTVAYWLGIVFVGLQLVAWWTLWREGVTITSSLYAWTFFVLTALHALHIAGGLCGMRLTLVRAREGAYSPIRHNGIMLCAMYWHSLAVIWFVLYAVLWVGSA